MGARSNGCRTDADRVEFIQAMDPTRGLAKSKAVTNAIEQGTRRSRSMSRCSLEPMELGGLPKRCRDGREWLWSILSYVCRRRRLVQTGALL